MVSMHPFDRVAVVGAIGKANEEVRGEGNFGAAPKPPFFVRRIAGTFELKTVADRFGIGPRRQPLVPVSQSLGGATGLLFDAGRRTAPLSRTIGGCAESRAAPRAWGEVLPAKKAPDSAPEKRVRTAARGVRAGGGHEPRRGRPLFRSSLMLRSGVHLGAMVASVNTSRSITWPRTRE